MFNIDKVTLSISDAMEIVKSLRANMDWVDLAAELEDYGCVWDGDAEDLYYKANGMLMTLVERMFTETFASQFLSNFGRTVYDVNCSAWMKRGKTPEDGYVYVLPVKYNGQALEIFSVHVDEKGEADSWTTMVQFSEKEAEAVFFKCQK